MKAVVLILALICINSALSQQQLNNRFGNGIINATSADSSWSMKFGLRFQTLYMGSNDIDEVTGIGAGSSQFMIRRARLKFDGFAYSPKLKYKIELGVSNSDLGKVDATTGMAPRMILDAVLKWNFYGNFELWGGQTKLPGNRERVISSANMQLVDRSLLNNAFNIDRDMGMQLHHSFTIGNSFEVREAFAVSQGEGRNLIQQNIGGLQYTSRIELLPFGDFSGKGDYIGGAIDREVKPKLALGFTYDFNDRTAKTRSNQGSYMIDQSGDNPDGYFHSDISTIFVDMMFKYGGWSVMGEYAHRNADVAKHVSSDSLSSATVSVGSGINLTLGYMFKSNWEVTGRYTQVNPDSITGNQIYSQYTMGVSKYIVGHSLKVQADVSYLQEVNNPVSKLMYRLQFDLHF